MQDSGNNRERRRNRKGCWGSRRGSQNIALLGTCMRAEVRSKGSSSSLFFFQRVDLPGSGLGGKFVPEAD
jgi:hypothetical protein